MRLRKNLTAIALGLSTITAIAQTGDGNLQIKEEGRIYNKLFISKRICIIMYKTISQVSI